MEKKSALSVHENNDVKNIPYTLMICFLNDFKEAKQLLINYKQLFKQFENPEAYTNFKEVMRILRKIKYENKT